MKFAKTFNVGQCQILCVLAEEEKESTLSVQTVIDGILLEVVYFPKELKGEQRTRAILEQFDDFDQRDASYFFNELKNQYEMSKGGSYVH